MIWSRWESRIKSEDYDSVYVLLAAPSLHENVKTINQIISLDPLWPIRRKRDVHMTNESQDSDQSGNQRCVELLVEVLFHGSKFPNNNLNIGSNNPATIKGLRRLMIIKSNHQKHRFGLLLD